MTSDATIELKGKRKIKPAGLLKKKAVLLVLSENQLGDSFLLKRESTTIGRGSGCDVIIKDPLVSKMHCRIFTDTDNLFYIEDAGSKNCTYLNGKTVEKPVHVGYGDRIIIGNTILRFFMAEDFKK